MNDTQRGKNSEYTSNTADTGSQKSKKSGKKSGGKKNRSSDNSEISSQPEEIY